MTKNIYKLTKKDIPLGAETLSSAFTNDPLWQKLFQGSEYEDKKRKAFFEIPLRQGIYYGNAYGSSSNLEGVGVVIPGKYAYTTLWQVIRTGCLGAISRVGNEIGSKVNKMFEPFIKEHKALNAKGEYLYINILGVNLLNQGKGLGGALLNAIIDEANQKSLPLYLETETEENVRFYEKYGFKVYKTITLPIVDHKMWTMIKEPS